MTFTILSGRRRIAIGEARADGFDLHPVVKKTAMPDKYAVLDGHPTGDTLSTKIATKGALTSGPCR